MAMTERAEALFDCERLSCFPLYFGVDTRMPREKVKDGQSRMDFSLYASGSKVSGTRSSIRHQKAVLIHASEFTTGTSKTQLRRSREGVAVPFNKAIEAP